MFALLVSAPAFSWSPSLVAMWMVAAVALVVAVKEARPSRRFMATGVLLAVFSFYAVIFWDCGDLPWWACWL